jgi:ABC-2 type transport system ATP-binding protein
LLLHEEPVNGLETYWNLSMRTKLRSMAPECRVVLVSSHLIGEMALTAERLVVIARGRLLADTSVAELSARAGSLEEAFLELTADGVEYRARAAGNPERRVR